jgi:hypothetical protein
MANPEFSFIYNVTIRQYRNESLFNDLEADETDVLILANGLREATDKAEDYAESLCQDGAYKFYEVVAVEELDTVYTGLSDPEDGYAENPEETDFIPDPGTEPETEQPQVYRYLFVDSKGTYPRYTYPETENTATGFGGLSCS